jgi:hypothetical protein
MTCTVLIMGTPPTSGCAPGKTWRAAAGYVGERLDGRFGGSVRFAYVELFSPEMYEHPELEPLVATGSPMPLVLVDGELRFSGGKLNVTAIERAVAERLAHSVVGAPATADPAPQEGSAP